MKEFEKRLNYHPDENTPKRIRDWLDLIYQSIHSPERPVLNTDNEGIRKAVELITYDNLTREERTQAKDKEANRTALLKLEERAKQEGKEEQSIEIARNLINLGLSNENIAKATGLVLEQIQKLRSEK